MLRVGNMEGNMPGSQALMSPSPDWMGFPVRHPSPISTNRPNTSEELRPKAAIGDAVCPQSSQ